MQEHPGHKGGIGFTLIEVMIVVAIIGLMATIAVPNYQRARKESMKHGCIVNLRQIDGAIQSWAMEQKKGPEEPVAFRDISGYLKGSVSCPAGGSTFDDSYTVSTAEETPLCRRQPAIHVLP